MSEENNNQEKKKEGKFNYILTIFVILTILFLGLYISEKITGNSISFPDVFLNNDDEVPMVKTCSDLEGFECSAEEFCEGEWLDSQDSFNCCSKECKPVINQEDLVLTEVFQLNIDNNEIGEAI